MAGGATTLYLRNRWLWGVAGVAMAAAGCWLLWIDEPGYSFVAGGVLILIDMLATRMIVTPEGIDYRRLWRRIRAGWGELSHIEPVRAGGRAVPYLILNVPPVGSQLDFGLPRHLRGRAIPLGGPWTRDGELDLELAIRRYAPQVFQSAPPPRPALAPEAGIFVPAAPPADQLRTFGMIFALLSALALGLIIAAELVK